MRDTLQLMGSLTAWTLVRAWHLSRPLGQGGVGCSNRTEPLDPSDRPVVKSLNPPDATPDGAHAVIRRLEAVDPSHIVKFIDAGTIDARRPRGRARPAVGLCGGSLHACPLDETGAFRAQ